MHQKLKTFTFIIPFLLWIGSCGLILAQDDSTFLPYFKNNCSQTCEICGKNSWRCLFNQIDCSIECECMNGFTGRLCQDLATNSNVDKSPPTTKKIWQNILLKLSKQEFIEVDNIFIDDLIRGFNQLIGDLLRGKEISSLDIYTSSIIFERLAELERQKFQLKEKSYLNIIEIFNYLIEYETFSMNRYKTSSSILKKANREYSNSSIHLFRSLDKLTAYLAFKEKKVLYKSDHIYIIASSDLSPSHPNFTFSIKSTPPALLSLQESTQQTRNLHIDSISLNEHLLIQRYKNNSIKIAFRIFFNTKTTVVDIESKQQEFINLNQRPQNFFYELTQDYDTSTRSGAGLLNEYVSSNILSAVIYDDSHQKLPEFPSPHLVEDKLVRIQFIIDLNAFKSRPDTRQLKCVFWSFEKLEWLTHGCYVSRKESGPISNTNFYRKVCYCDHLTNFAIIFDPKPFAPPITQPFHTMFKQILSILTLIGVVISSICYTIMIITRCCFSTSQRNSSYRDDVMRSLYLANAICLLCANICFLVISNIQEVSVFKLAICHISATGLHYFLLTAFCFSLATAWEHFKRLVRVFDKSNDVSYSFEFMLVFSVLGPLALALTGFLYNQPSHPNYESIDVTSCWLKPPYLYYFFVIPITLLLLVSLNLYIFVSVKVTRIYRRKLRFSSEAYDQKRVIVILTFSFISLGLTWLFGVLIVISAQVDENLKLAMEFLFCSFNAFHGLSLMVAHVIAQEFNGSHASRNVKLKRIGGENGQDSARRKLSLSSHFFLIFYGSIYLFLRFFGCNRRGMNDSSKQKPPHKSTCIEVTIINDASDTDIRTSSF